MIHNHFEGVAWMCTKRGLLELLQGTDLQPKSWTFKRSAVNQTVVDEFLAEAKAGVYIVKPGEFSNRGSGIKLFPSPAAAASSIEEFLANDYSVVIQKYIEKPLLYEGRKFDIRSYGLIATQNGINFESFFYPHVYVRTASEPYDLRNLENRLVHLNNDAVQKHGKNYGKTEVGNKLTLDALCKKLKKDPLQIIEEIRSKTAVVFHNASQKLNPRNLPTCFEVVGFDWMIDAHGRVFLIEANTNPCLELVSSWLAHVIPAMLDGAFALTVDKWTAPLTTKEDGKLSDTGKNKWIPLNSCQ
jgi:hypothetical protein